MDEENPHRVIQVIPGGGWMIWREGGHEEWSQPVVGWALHANGTVTVLDTDMTGFADRPGGGEQFEVWHPDSTSDRAEQRQRQHLEQLKARDA